jgi:methylated-DNA-[protein]-cysteine S-methyltransferase
MTTPASRRRPPLAVRQRRWHSPLGELRIVAGERGIVRLDFCDGRGALAAPAADAPAGDALLDRAVAQLAEYWAGARQSFDLPLDLRGTPFQLAVWRALLELRYGAATTYQAVAARIGRPSAVRAVGAANGANPISVIVPCHRLIGADGSLRGYGGGLDRKRALLELERRYAQPGLAR